MRGIYGELGPDGFRCHDIGLHTKLHKEWFSHSEVDKGDTQTYRHHDDYISLLLFFAVRKVG
jgi:hypothetical protein